MKSHDLTTANNFVSIEGKLLDWPLRRSSIYPFGVVTNFSLFSVTGLVPVVV